MEWFWIPFFICLGCLFGMLVGMNIQSIDVSGVIIIDETDEDGPYMFIEIEEPLYEFCERTRATVKVIVRDPSQ